MKTIDLSKVKVKKRIDSDELTETDVSKHLAQTIYANTAQIIEHKFAYQLLDNPVVELTEENKQIINQYIPMGFVAIVQVAVNKLMEEV